MNNTKPLSRPNSKSISEHPFYFGAFLNIARHNAFMVMRHLSAKHDMEDKDRLDENALGQAKLFNCLKEKFNKPDITEAIIRDLKRYFTFLNYPLFLNLKQQESSDDEVSFETNPQQLGKTLKALFLLLNRMRNHYSHYISTVDYSGIPFEPVQDIYKAAVYRVTDRGKHTQRFDVFEEQHIKHLKGKESNYRPQPLTETAKLENTITFITCLFLERKYAFPFLSRLTDFQFGSAGLSKMNWKATLEAYTMFCCRLPQPKLESSDILLDMVNELGRCPSALYTVLSEADRHRFHIQREETDELDDEAEQLEQEIVLKRHSDRFPYFALRYFDDTDAFPTMRFDVYLGRWRSKPVYTKKIYGEERERLLTRPIRTFAKLNRIRPLYEAITQDDDEGKRVSADFVKNFRESWIKTDEEGRSYLVDKIEQFSPQYNFGDNVIGLKFVNVHRAKKIQDVLPKLPLPEDKGATVRNEQADAIMSTHELRSLFLYHYLYQTPIEEGSSKTFLSEDPESFIKRYIEQIKAFFEDVKSGELQPISSPPDYRKNEPLPFVKGNREKTQEKRAQYRDRQEEMKARRAQLNDILQKRYSLSITQIPSRLKEYLLGYKVAPYKVRAIQKFKEQQATVKELLKDAKKGRSPRVGQQATWLAEDIVFLTPPKVHEVDGVPHLQKLNNDQFRTMQSSLAYFSANKQKIKAFFAKETDILSQNPQERHPFLFKIRIEECNGILDFYMDYLEAKEKWLNSLLKKIKRMKDAEVEERYGDYLPSSVRHKPPKELDYTRLPLYLPRGLFNRAIAEALSAQKGQGVKPEDNVIYCMEKLMAGDLQEFYALPHYYRSLLTQKGEEPEWVTQAEHGEEIQKQLQKLEAKKAKAGKLSRTAKQDLKNELKDAKRAKRRLLDREQYLRAVQTEDRALWLMIQDRQKQVSEHMEIDFDQLKLKNIESILKEPVKVSLQIPETTIRITDELPLRRYGDLRRIAKDRRLKNLALYYQKSGEQEITHERVKAELEQYDKRRQQFFEEIHEFEREVFERYGEELAAAYPEGKSSFYKHRTYVDIATQHSADMPFNLFFRNQVADMRNKFHHNEFPMFEWLDAEVAAREADLYADRVFDIAEGYYRRLRSLIR